VPYFGQHGRSRSHGAGSGEAAASVAPNVASIGGRDRGSRRMSENSNTKLDSGVLCRPGLECCCLYCLAQLWPVIWRSPLDLFDTRALAACGESFRPNFCYIDSAAGWSVASPCVGDPVQSKTVVGRDDRAITRLVSAFGLSLVYCTELSFTDTQCCLSNVPVGFNMRW
jgi:hypothetical protein